MAEGAAGSTAHSVFEPQGFDANNRISARYLINKAVFNPAHASKVLTWPEYRSKYSVKMDELHRVMLVTRQLAPGEDLAKNESGDHYLCVMAAGFYADYHASFSDDTGSMTCVLRDLLTRRDDAAKSATEKQGVMKMDGNGASPGDTLTNLSHIVHSQSETLLLLARENRKLTKMLLQPPEQGSGN